MRRFGKWLGRALGLALLAGALIFFVVLPPYVEKQRNAVQPHAPYPVSPQAQTLHDTLTIGDWHADSLLWARDLTTHGDRGQVDIPRLQQGNVALQVFTAVTKSPSGQNYDANSAQAFDNITPLVIGQRWPTRTWQSLLERALYQAEKLHEFAQDAPDDLMVITSQADLDALLNARAAGSPIIGGMLGVEGAHPLELKLDNLDALEQAGHRVIGLHHFFDNGLGGSLHGLSNRGLTDFGRAVVLDIQRRGMILDLAHSSPQVARDVLEITDMPLIVSHTGLHSHCPVKRNFPDDLMRAIAQTGGTIGLGYWQGAACDDITPNGIARMIAAGVRVLGEDHVSLGSDFDGSVATAFDTSELAALTQGLLDQGLTPDQIRKVMGDNMIRVLRARLN